ncbi:IMP cyclohydrolase [Solidesulfovibrio magneticus]|uniref:IMP cyclohydrolase n=1 Tax=Solidesulfovibrio magneticus (strain ATCC 700980 / DSM 13731 / RS-1) TaxID=573370 RepID=C4XRS5_SOLM1|nr:IMP cyclohydrolase [Solidesulfovibrio magneticus]BAH77991.1 putative IMP cyclohydrolase [Solidesulfovibrio magneticus RS-1]
MDFLPVKRALLSVTDKSGLPELARFLSAAGVELVSTGGTRKMLVEAGLPVTSVSDVTGFPEILNGRVKTLHPNVHGGILADKDNPEHVATLEKHGIAAFDMVVVNLYAFSKALEKGLPLPEMVEQIDIGGPTLLRASAKNFASILVVPDPAFYPEVMDALAQNGMKAPLALRQKTAAATFRQTSAYDDAIATYLAGA